MTRTRCYFCPHMATRNTRGHDPCELHYAQVNAGRAEDATIRARDFPPHRIIERLHLVEVLEEMLSAARVQEILGESAWFKQIQAIRAKAKELREARL